MYVRVRNLHVLSHSNPEISLLHSWHVLILPPNTFADSPPKHHTFPSPNAPPRLRFPSLPYLIPRPSSGDTPAFAGFSAISSLNDLQIDHRSPRSLLIVLAVDFCLLRLPFPSQIFGPFFKIHFLNEFLTRLGVL